MISEKFKKLQAGVKPDFNQKILEQFDQLRDHFRVRKFSEKRCYFILSNPIEKAREAANDHKRFGIPNYLQIY